MELLHSFILIKDALQNTTHITVGNTVTIQLLRDLSSIPSLAIIIQSTLDEIIASTSLNVTIKVINSPKLLGTIINDKLNWNPLANSCTSSTYRLHMLQTRRQLGVLVKLFSTFTLQKLRQAFPVWSSSLTITQKSTVKLMQKMAVKIIICYSYTNYHNAIIILNMWTVSNLHQIQVLLFGTKLINNLRYRAFLQPGAPPPQRAVRHRNQFVAIRAPRNDSYKKSSIPTIIKFMNS